MKGKSKTEANWNVRNQEYTASDIRLDIKDGPHKSMRDELDDHPEDYHYLTYEYWCELLSTIEVQYERKISAVNIKKISPARSASLYDRDTSLRILSNKKAKTGVLRTNKSPKKEHRHHGIQRYCVIYNKAVIDERNYTSHSAKDCTGVRTNRFIKDGMGGLVGSRTYAVKQYKKSENK